MFFFGRDTVKELAYMYSSMIFIGVYLSLSEADMILLRPFPAGGVRLRLRDLREASESDSEVDMVSLDTNLERCFELSFSSAAFAFAFSLRPMPFSPCIHQLITTLYYNQH